MIIYNTTNIPNKSVMLAFAFSMPKGIEINSITLRNKTEDKIHGNWGCYYYSEKRITLCIPQEIRNFKDYRKHVNTTVILKDRTEFLVMVIAHELRHAWQYQVSGWNKTLLKNTGYIEYDAEKYEQEKLDLWRSVIGKSLEYAATRSIGK